MQARDEFLTRVMSGPKQFLIPIFQRTYSWPTKHCEQLFKDVKDAGTLSGIQSHFVGSIVLAPNESATNSSIPQWQVIDGQQRLTSFTLLILAMIHQAKTLSMTMICDSYLDAIKDYYISNSFGQNDTRYKLLLTQSDNETLKCLVDGRKVASPVSERVMENFECFCEQLSDVQTIELIFKGLQKIKVVEVMLTSQDDPQAIFESLNSTGLDLGQADLIRNYVLMRHEHGEQTRLYQQHWYPLERLFARQPPARFDRFMQDFLTLELGSNTVIRSKDIYSLFKHWFNGEMVAQNAEYALDRMHQLAGYYASYMFGTETDKKLARSFHHLRTLVEVAGPVVMRLYEGYSNDQAKNDEFVKAISLLESYVLRRSVCGMDTRSLGNTFAMIAQRIDLEAPLESLSVTLARITSRFPTNEEFYAALCEGDLYGKKACRFVLERLENDSKEQIDTQNFSVEHVMPQNKNLRPEWKTMLGENWLQVQHTWLHRLGNLTLTGYNSEYKDHAFSAKKGTNNGFDESPLRLNRDIAKETKWTVQQMKARGEKLAKQALSVWAPLSIDEATINRYHKVELQRRSDQINISEVPEEQWTPFYDRLHAMILELNSELTCITSKTNISFYHLEPVIQVVNRKRGLGIVLAIDYEDLDPDLAELVVDTNTRTFRNVSISGVQTVLKSEEEIDRIRPVIQAALEYVE